VPYERRKPESLATKLRERREELGLSKVEAARRAGISRTTWHELEEGMRDGAHVGTLRQIAAALEMPADKLGVKVNVDGFVVRDDGTMSVSEAKKVFVSHASEDTARLEMIRLALELPLRQVQALVLFFGDPSQPEPIAELLAYGVARQRQASSDNS
jgi:transcriptional regulator with XRE-family HTH domain